MVERETEPHRWPGDDLAIADHRALGNTSDPKDRAFRPVNDRGECLDAKHSHVADREGPAADIFAAQLSLPSAIGDVADCLGNLQQRSSIAVSDHGNDQAVFDGDGHANVDVRVKLNSLVDEAG